MIAVLQLIDIAERKLAMAKAPTKVRHGIPIGNFDVVRDAAGKATVKPKRKPAPPQAQYAAKNRKKWMAAK